MGQPDFDLRHPAAVTPIRDPDLYPDDEEPKPATALEELRAELQADLSKGLVTLEVPDRAGWTVTYSADITLHDLLFHRNRNVIKSGPRAGELDELKYAQVMLALQCRSIAKNGDTIDVEGKPATFGSPAFQEIVGVPAKDIPSAVTAVHRFYRFDGAILATFGKLLLEAGFAQQVDTVDPTPRSSTDS